MPCNVHISKFLTIQYSKYNNLKQSLWNLLDSNMRNPPREAFFEAGPRATRTRRRHGQISEGIAVVSIVITASWTARHQKQVKSLTKPLDAWLGIVLITNKNEESYQRPKKKLTAITPLQRKGRARCSKLLSFLLSLWCLHQGTKTHLPCFR